MPFDKLRGHCRLSLSKPTAASSVFPGRRPIHLAVVLRQVTFHPIYIRFRNVDTTASAPHDSAGRHHRARYGNDASVDGIANE